MHKLSISTSSTTLLQTGGIHAHLALDNLAVQLSSTHSLREVAMLNTDTMLRTEVDTALEVGGKG